MKRRKKLSAESQALLRIHNLYPSLPPHMFEDLVCAPERLRKIFDKLSVSENGNYRQGRVALIGLVSRAYQLYIGGLQQLAEGNTHVWSGCFRGLLETVGAVAYVQKYPSRVVHLIDEQGISAGKLRNALAAVDTAYAKDIDKVNRLVHPADLSLWASIQHGETEHLLIIGLGTRKLSQEEIMKGAAALLQSVEDFAKYIQTLCQEQPSILDQGRLFMTVHA